MAEKRTRARNGRAAGQVDRTPLEVGVRLLDLQGDVEGVIVDHACQYAHPKAPPVFSYLVRWEDGQVNAMSEAALSGDHGVEIVEEEY